MAPRSNGVPLASCWPVVTHSSLLVNISHSDAPFVQDGSDKAAVAAWLVLKQRQTAASGILHGETMSPVTRYGSVPRVHRPVLHFVGLRETQLCSGTAESDTSSLFQQAARPFLSPCFCIRCFPVLQPPFACSLQADPSSPLHQRRPVFEFSGGVFHFPAVLLLRRHSAALNMPADPGAAQCSRSLSSRAVAGFVLCTGEGRHWCLHH